MVEDEGIMDITPLDEILNGSDPGDENPVSEAPEVTETQEAERERDELGRFKAKDTGEETPDEPVAAPPAAETEQERVPIAALMGERQKRQQLEDRLRQYDEYFARLNREPEQPQEAPDPFTDPDAHQAYVIEQAVSKAIERLTPQLQQSQVMSRAEVSEMLARQKFADYDQKIEAFKEAIQENPFLVSQVQNAPDPATFAYNAATKYLEAKQYGTAAPSREQIEAEVEARLREKIMGELGMNSPKVPSTLADSRSVGSRSGPAWSGPTPLDSILNS